MVIDARELENHAVLHADLCIVGGGAAGITLAREFIGRPVTVCVLESGGRSPDPLTQSLADGDSVGFPYFPLQTARCLTLGGSSALWHVPLGGDRVGARMRPLDAIDFEERDWVPNSGWPFPKSDLDGYYERAQEVCRVGPPTFEVEHWDDTRSLQRLSVLGDDVQTIIYKFCQRDLFARKYPDEVAGASNITTCLHAHVLRIQTNESGAHVEHVRGTTFKGNEFVVRAKIFVLAAGGIDTPRLLLLSNETQPAGLANDHDLVGRFFMEHLHFWSGMLIPAQAELFDRTTLFNDIRTIQGTAVVGKLTLREKVLRRERLLNQNVQLFVRPRPDPFKYPAPDPEPLEALKILVRDRDFSHAGAHVRTIVSKWQDLAVAGVRRWRTLPMRSVFVLANMTEQAPNPDSRVTLGQDRDAFGQPRAALNWKIGSQDIASAIRTQEILGAAFERAGWGRFYRELVDADPPAGTEGGYHHMGTTRMHANPKEGVVNPDGRVHGIDNTYIAGPSVFPTGGYANPVLTVVALTLRLADHLKNSAALS